ncbi:MAG TPA: hypothetical protein PKA00_04630 [Saprospiraceae bacterium]|nr:hypothetical protein [Saprospiraceae bacterium]HMQ82166.1 hypothetical protein [Saprospiraceae bacterium]
MFHHQTRPFGAFEIHELLDDRGNQLAIVPAFGACVTALCLYGTPILDCYQTPEEMLINRWMKNVFIFPFPNRLKDGNYTWQGKHYQFPINDTVTGTALHGFPAEQQPMQLIDVTTSEHQAAMTCVFDYDGHKPYYPFPISLRVRFELDDVGHFGIESSIINKHHQEIPFGFGWHPYYSLSKTVDQMSLQLPDCEMIGIDAEMIPTGKRYPYSIFEQRRLIGSEVLDNGFYVIPDGAEETSIELAGTEGKLQLWQQTGEKGFSYLQIFTPPHRLSLAVEPMSCNINAFRNGEGLWILTPGVEKKLAFGLGFTKNG